MASFILSFIGDLGKVMLLVRSHGNSVG
ncbi:MAG: hypothetical protein ACD_50C00181G0001, partial [uncultured bacterium]